MKTFVFNKVNKPHALPMAKFALICQHELTKRLNLEKA